MNPTTHLAALLFGGAVMVAVPVVVLARTFSKETKK